MKNIFALLLAWSFVSVSNGQQSASTGPGVKNKKAWSKENTAINLYHHRENEAVTGPKARNRKAWEKKDTIYRKIKRKKRDHVTGPKFKNRKPWKKD